MGVRTQLVEQTTQLTGWLDTGYSAAQILPSMLGAEGPRNYFVAFQTNAEARGTGGLMGGSAIVRAENGQISVEKPESNLELELKYDPIDLGLNSRKCMAETWRAPRTGKMRISVPTSHTLHRSGDRSGPSIPA